jgi:hypothetical protein
MQLMRPWILEEHKYEEKKLFVSESICFPFEKFDFVVVVLDHTGGERAIKVVQDAA